MKTIASIALLCCACGNSASAPNSTDASADANTGVDAGLPEVFYDDCMCFQGFPEKLEPLTTHSSCPEAQWDSEVDREKRWWMTSYPNSPLALFIAPLDDGKFGVLLDGCPVVSKTMSNTSAPDPSVQEQIQALTNELATMRAELSALRNTPRTSLKQHYRCPNCQSTSILHCNEIRDYNTEGYTPMSLQLTGIFRKRSKGSFEVYICRQCELAEWYVRGAGEIDPAKLDKKNRKNIRIIDNEIPASGPFR